MRAAYGKRLLLGAVAAMVASAASAHEVWVERDGSGPARVYLGEPVERQPPAGDPEFPKLKAPVVFNTDPSKPATLTRRANHIEAAVGPGDVRVRDDNIFKPWTGDDGLTAGVYYGRAGRSETRAALDLEITPTAANSDTFVVMFKGKPLPGASVTVINPELWSKVLKADENGRVKAPVTGPGRYLLGVNHPEKAAATIAGQQVAAVSHTSTTTFFHR